MIHKNDITYKGLYIHIPFCASKCPYCDFYSVKMTDKLAEEYKNAVIDEIKTGRRCKSFTDNENLCFDTVYFGGGTPSFFGGGRIAEILHCINENYTMSPNTEITVECNPSSSDEKLFNTLKNAGVNRISLGMQSFNDDERRLLGRTADGEKVKNALLFARAAGIENISLDIMLGIERQTIRSLDKTMDFCLSLDVPHISAYMLKIEENTVFAKRLKKMKLPDEDEVCDMYLHLINRLKENGIYQYEISNFAKPGFESRHNLKYWKCEEYLGIGASAHSFINGKRFFFERSIDGFIKGDKANFDSIGGNAEEYIMLKLRLSEGLNFEEYKNRFNIEINKSFIEKAERLSQYGYVISDENGIRLTPEGFLISNTIIGEILNC